MRSTFLPHSARFSRLLTVIISCQVSHPKNLHPSFKKTYVWCHFKNRVSDVIFVKNDAKVDTRCHILKIDKSYLKYTKIYAKEKKKEKEEKIGMNLLKSPLFEDRTNRLHDEEI